ncbi:MAG TPA: hypothetical protein VF924_02010 [Stellaceae bacterium]|jgi:hypothetical protein
MRPMPIIAAAALLFAASGAAWAANPTRIAETGAALLGNAHRCGVADDRVVRAGKVIRELIVAAADDPGEQTAAKSRFAEIFRETARPEGSGRMPIPPCHAVVSQFERLEQFHGQTGR